MLAWKNSRDKGLASPPSPPASAPDSIIHQAPHTTLSPQAHGHSKVTNAPTVDGPNSPSSPHTPLTRAHTVPLVQAHVARSTHTFTLTNASAGCSRP